MNNDKRGELTLFIEDALAELTDDELKKDYGTYTFQGHIVPRVTEILSSYSTGDALMMWANSLGFRHIKYRDALNKAANTGTNTHHHIEVYLKTGETFSDDPAFMGFIKWWNKLKMFSTSLSVLGSEVKLVSRYFGGTYDLLLEIDGKVYLVDFKTSNHVTSKYFMQLAAYRRMLYENKGINIDGCIVLQLCKTEPEFNEFFLDFTIPNHYAFIEECTRAFLALVYSFDCVKIVEDNFNHIFGG